MLKFHVNIVVLGEAASPISCKRVGRHLPLEGVAQGLNGLFAEAVLPAELFGEPCRIVTLRNVDSLAALATRHGNVNAELDVTGHTFSIPGRYWAIVCRRGRRSFLRLRGKTRPRYGRGPRAGRGGSMLVGRRVELALACVCCTPFAVALCWELQGG